MFGGTTLIRSPLLGEQDTPWWLPFGDALEQTPYLFARRSEEEEEKEEDEDDEEDDAEEDEDLDEDLDEEEEEEEEEGDL